MVHLAVKYAKFYMTQGHKDVQMTYTKYHENAVNYLKLTTVNELVQTHRVNQNAFEALLRAFSLVSD